MSSLLAVLLLLLIPACISIGVAPDDADQDCLTDPATSNMLITDPTQVVLLDTLHYRPQTLLTVFGGTLKWISLKFLPGNSQQRWTDFSQSQTCEHELVSCYFMTGAQNNWMITQYINISNPQVTDLNVSATYATNVNVNQCTGSCTQNVPIHFYWTNTLNETERNDTSNYGDVAAARLVHIGNNGVRESTSLTVSVPQGSNGAYLALVDEGTCVYISRLVVSYTVCPAQKMNLISYPEVTAPTVNNLDDKMVPVTCVEGASTIGSETLECNIGGRWGNIDSSICQCNPGYQLNETNLNACEACPPEHFKSSRSNTERCRPCPGFSSSPVGNQAVCMCDAEYYRAPTDSPSDDCTAPPTAPRNVNAPVLTGILITLTWLPPLSTGGRSDLKYDVSYMEGTTTITRTTSFTNITLTSLTPVTNYLFSVEAMNGVSEQVGNPADRTAYLNVTTPQQPPSETQMVELNNNVLSWRQPAELYGEELLRFEILAARSDDPSRAEVVHTLGPSVTSFPLDDLRPLLPAGQSFVWVRAVSTGGDGVISASGIAITGAEMSVGIIIGASAGAIFGIALLLVICLIVLIILVKKQPKQEKYVVEEPEVIPSAPNGVVVEEMETGLIEEMQNLSTDETKYVDPRNYHSPYDALSALRVDEIPPREIKLSQPLGEGEFGVVYKGKWTSGKEARDVAIKTLRGGANSQDTENFLMEASVMRQFRNHHVVQLYGIVSKVEPIMIIMEFMKNGSLDHYLKSNIDKLDTKRQLKMAHGVASGMAYLSSKEYVHRDLAARNVLVSKDEKCKVADFGLARVMKENVYEVQRGGRIPVRWTAPEAIAYREFTSSSDVWSFGVLLWEIFSYGQTPYDDWNNHEVLERVDRGERLRQPRSCPNDVYIDIMLNCWEADRQDRPTFKDLRKMLDVKIFGRERPEVKPRQPVVEATDDDNTHEDTPIDTWLNSIKMDRYTDVFVKNGYKTVADCAKITKEQLQEMGITARGHLHKITSNLPPS